MATTNRIENKIEKHFAPKNAASSEKVGDGASDGLNVVVMVKDLDGPDRERYVFIYADGEELEVLRTFGLFASNAELSFSWYDAAVLARKIRGERRGTR